MSRLSTFAPTRLAAAGLLVLAASVPLRLAGQQPVPISRADLTRMLEGDTYTPDEVARMIRRVCIGFRLADDDLRRFREIGATDEIVDALAACREAGNAAAAGASLRLVLPDSLTVRAGDTAVVRGRVTRRGGEGVSGVPVVLQVVAPDDAERRLTAATSEARGEIVFRLPAGARTGRVVLGPRAASVSLVGSPRTELIVRAGPPAAVDVRPPELTVVPGGRDSVMVRVRLTDAHGNGVPGVRVDLALRAPAGGSTLARGATGPGGYVPLPVPSRRLDGVERLGVWVRDSVLTWIPVRAAAPERQGGSGRIVVTPGPP